MTIVHLEFQVSDLKAGMAFYGDLLGWTFARMGDMDYYLISGDGIGAVSYTHLTLPTIYSV